jgi:hypothetical protein
MGLVNPDERPAVEHVAAAIDLTEALNNVSVRLDALDSQERVLTDRARRNRVLIWILAGLVAVVAIGAGITLAILQVRNDAAVADARSSVNTAAIAAVKAEDYKLCASGNVYRARERAAMEGARGALNGPPWQETPESRAYAARLKDDVARLTAPRDCAHL